MSPIHGTLTKIRILLGMRLQLMKVSCNLKTEFHIFVCFTLKSRFQEKRKPWGIVSFLLFSAWPQNLEIKMKKGSKTSSKG